MNDRPDRSDDMEQAAAHEQDLYLEWLERQNRLKLPDPMPKMGETKGDSNGITDQGKGR